MRVKFIGVGGPNQIGAVNQNKKTEGSKGAEGVDRQDQVQFSSVLQGIGQSKAASAGNEAERAARVAELKAQVAEGSYRPDLDRVASSLLEFLMEEK